MSISCCLETVLLGDKGAVYVNNLLSPDLKLLDSWPRLNGQESSSRPFDCASYTLQSFHNQGTGIETNSGPQFDSDEWRNIGFTRSTVTSTNFHTLTLILPTGVRLDPTCTNCFTTSGVLWFFIWPYMTLFISTSYVNIYMLWLAVMW